jgi:hypothetical protein
LQNDVNNLPDAFIDYNGVIKSWNPMVNAPERVEVSKKITQAPSTKKRGKKETTRKDTTLEKRPRKEKTKTPRKTKKVIQSAIERHHKNANNPQSSSQARYTNETRISEIPDNLILGIDKISIK